MTSNLSNRYASEKRSYGFEPLVSQGELLFSGLSFI